MRCINNVHVYVTPTEVVTTMPNFPYYYKLHCREKKKYLWQFKKYNTHYTDRKQSDRVF